MTWIGWSLLSAFFAALTAVLAKIGVEHVDSNLATAIRTTVVVVAAWAIACATHRQGAFASIDRRTLAFLAASGLATTLSCSAIFVHSLWARSRRSLLWTSLASSSY